MTIKQETLRRTVLTAAYRNYSKALNTYAYFKVNDHEMSDDLVQDTFMKTWNYLSQGKKIDAMKSFLYHILNNLIVDEYRRKKNKSSSLDILIENGFEPSIDETERNSNILDGKSAVLLLTRLPSIYQNVINMRFIKDLSLKEMSVITGQSENSMAVQVHRGLTKLKTLYNY